MPKCAKRILAHYLVISPITGQFSGNCERTYVHFHIGSTSLLNQTTKH